MKEAVDLAKKAAEQTAHAELWYHEPKVWVAFGFVGFVYVFIRYAWKPIVAGLDARAEKIKSQLEQAAKLKADAKALLIEYEKQKKAAAKEAKAILDAAKKDAQELRARALEELEASLARRTQQAEEKIARAGAEATRQVREQIVLLANDAARDVITSTLKDSKEDPAIHRAVAAISKQMH